VSCLGVSPNGDALCTGSWDSTLKVRNGWNLLRMAWLFSNVPAHSKKTFYGILPFFFTDLGLRNRNKDQSENEKLYHGRAKNLLPTQAHKCGCYI
jgi:hypothetical protein